MRTIIALAAAASLLTLAACNREAELAPTTDIATAPVEATSTNGAGVEASTRAASGGSGSSGSASPADTASETMSSAGSSASNPTGSGVGPVTQETRDSAKMAAEETNLHPKPPTE